MDEKPKVERIIKVEFEGIDFWNRPVFKSTTSNSRYGSVDKLFDYNTGKEEVLESIKAEDLLFFGNSFGCEPMGDLPLYELVIVE